MTNPFPKRDAAPSNKQEHVLELLDTGPCGVLGDTQLERIKQAYYAGESVKILGSLRTFLPGQLD